MAMQIQTINGDPLVTWSAIATGDTLEAFELGDKQGLAFAVQFDGTFGGATVKLQASNDGTTWFDLKDLSLLDISATDDALFDGGTAARYLRPSISGGTSDEVNVRLMARGT